MVTISVSSVVGLDDRGYKTYRVLIYDRNQLLLSLDVLLLAYQNTDFANLSSLFCNPLIESSIKFKPQRFINCISS